MSVILEVADLQKSFGAVVAARDINVTVEEHEVVGIIGANGAGKTTFVNMVTGYLTPSAGEIRFEGRNVTGLDPRRTARAGIRRSFQIAQVFPELTAIENLVVADVAAGPSVASLLGPSLTPARLSAARAVLERFGLLALADQPTGTLPQGQRKQLDIAMAAVSNPSLILLDEPTSGVSADEKLEMMEQVLQPLQHEGATVLFIEHDMDIVRRFAERVVAFDEGSILADGSVEDVLANPDVRERVIGGVDA